MNKNKEKFITILAIAVLAIPFALTHSSNVNAVETSDAWTDYYHMGTSGNRSHPYVDAHNFTDISKKERKLIMSHFNSLFHDEVVPNWDYPKIEKVSDVNNGSYSQELFIPLTYTPKGVYGEVDPENNIGDRFLKPSVEKRLFSQLINLSHYNAMGVDHNANTHVWYTGVETSNWKVPMRDITYVDTTHPELSPTGVVNKPLGISITRTIKNTTDPLKPMPKQPIVDIDSTGYSTVTVYKYKHIKKGKRHISKLVKNGKIPSHSAFYVYGKSRGNLLRVGKNKYVKSNQIHRNIDSVY